MDDPTPSRRIGPCLKTCDVYILPSFFVIVALTTSEKMSATDDTTKYLGIAVFLWRYYRRVFLDTAHPYHTAVCVLYNGGRSLRIVRECMSNF